MTATGASSASSVYGPVRSWRFGISLGVDPILTNSVCSFRCAYCQLGKINLHTSQRQLFVDARRFQNDLLSSQWSSADVVTFSGSGEPTLAANLRELIDIARAVTRKPIVILTNASLLNDASLRNDLLAASHISCKLDAADEETFQKVNRPSDGITLDGIVDGITALRHEYRGVLSLQTMILPSSRSSAAGLAKVVCRIGPDEIHLNLPSRSSPTKWSLPCRGDNQSIGGLRSVDDMAVNEFASELARYTNVRVLARYEPAHQAGAPR